MRGCSWCCVRLSSCIHAVHKACLNHVDMVLDFALDVHRVCRCVGTSFPGSACPRSLIHVVHVHTLRGTHMWSPLGSAFASYGHGYSRSYSC